MATPAAGAGAATEQVQQKKGWMPEVETGCYCCKLETCCKVQAYFVALTSVLYVPMLMQEHFRTYRDCSTLVDPTELQMLHCQIDMKRKELAESRGTARVAELIIRIVLEVITFMVAILFLVGINTRRPKLLLPYIRVLAVHLFFNLMVLIVRACVEPLFISTIIFTFPIGVGVPYYMWVCAHSLHRKMMAGALPASTVPARPVRMVPRPLGPGVRPAGPFPLGFGYAPPPAYAADPPGYVAGLDPATPGGSVGESDYPPPPPYEVAVNAIGGDAKAAPAAAPPQAGVRDDVDVEAAAEEKQSTPTTNDASTVV